MTKAERLRHPCPKCHQKAGAPCVDPLGDIMPRCHAIRGPGMHEAHKEKEAARINARTVASYGPLFADLAAAEVPTLTAADLIERDRRAHTRSFDEPSGPNGVALLRQCNKGIEWIHVHHLARELERLTGDLGREFAATAVRTYPLDYLHHEFRRLMTTTERKEIGPYRVPAEGTALGFRIAYRHLWAPAAPLMTPEEFDRLYPRPNHYRPEPQAEPDDAGLFARTIGQLRSPQA